ncbi:OmpA family protein [Qipengyuania sp. 1NDW9]|uniref:OmpA family protein n=3 Tax=Erythrobacteraceae TaxID=335929 RepID=A0A9Q3S212_9SPHN|nr:OmpA family protein [Qipengyuania xiapuensis]MBX7492144.1 OmpA family protein [Qipengyuania xiapuensis]MBY6127781.1 OmpA family protein [Qipengyuania aquimaris]MBY6218683.1 OmpA family protein [Qipengyuania aquimaris]QZD93792.1 OmpA family protein [Qipengyuania xiapuensis]
MSLSAQEVEATDSNIDVYGSALTEGPEVEGIITSRSGDKIRVTLENGTTTDIIIDEGTEIRATGGFLGMSSKKLTSRQLLNGLPVEVDTLQFDGGLVASRVKLKASDLETAAMIRGATAQQFAEQREDIDANTAAAEALRGRMANIDQYNVRGVTNVYFDSGKWNISAEGEREICEIASQAEAMDNALLLVVGYTDSDGDEDYNQVLSERRAGRVTNYLQQKCGWKPWRMLTPTGMSESDPAADNSTPEGKAQNRRVSVNILVSKATEEG